MKKIFAKGSIALGSVMAAGSAMAIDFTAAATSATTEINNALNAAVPVGIVVLTAVVGWGVFKRFAKG